MAYAVARRRREIGIRIAIGADAIDVVRLVAARVATLIAGGIAAGIILSLAVAPLLAKVVYQTAPRDPQVFLLVATTLAGMAVVACWTPVRRALRIDPAAALRTD